MKFKNSIGSVTAILLAISLTSCTPPKPPELLAQEAEQTHTCISGNTKVSFASELDAASPSWQESLTAACAQMSFTDSKASEPTDLAISLGAPNPSTCTPLVSVPYALDAGVVVATFTSGAQIQLSAKSISGILSGQITNWADPSIVKDNPSAIVASQPIVVTPQADKAALDALTEWLQRLYPNFKNNTVTASDTEIDPTTLPDGSFTVMPFSQATVAGLIPSNIVYGKSPLTDFVAPSVDTIDSAASQYAISHDSSGVSVKIDPNKKPTPPLGSDTAAPPYQGVFVIRLTLCGAENLTHRALAKFLLRQDSQGALGNTPLLQLPEQLRAESLVEIEKGLPSSTPSPRG